ncbi:hypothetical protein [uncultured Fibrobacter sp.]|nr:hypothetical protein [uncultured Fibrobacter sp.]
MSFNALTVKGGHFTGLCDNASSVKTGDSSLSGMVHRLDSVQGVLRSWR